MVEVPPTRRRTAILLAGLLVYAVGAGAGLFQAVLNSFNFLYFRPDDWALRYVFAPLGLVAGTILGVFLHELGHAGAARLLSADVFDVQIGSGLKLAQFRFAGFPSTIHGMPLFGAVHYGLSSVEKARLKMFVIVAAGPMVSLIVAAISIPIAWYFLRSPGVANLHPQLFAVVTGFATANVVILPGTLLPFKFKSDGRNYKTDVLLLLGTPFMKDERIAAFVEWSWTRKELKDGYLSVDGAMALSQRFPTNARYLDYALQTLRGYKDPRALDIARKMVELNAANPSQRIRHLDSLLTVALDRGEIQDLPDAEQLLREITSLAPDDPSIRGTRGSVLIDLGQIENGRPLLEEVLARSTSDLEKAYCHIFLALAAHRRGQTKEADDHATSAHKLTAANCMAMDRLDELKGRKTAVE